MAIPVSGRTYTLSCVGATCTTPDGDVSKRVLNLYYPNSIENGQNVCLWVPDGSREQRWLYTNNCFLTRVNPSFALDKFTSVGNPNNANADIWKANDVENQRINFVSLGGNTVKIKLYHSGLYLTAYSNVNGSANGKTPTSSGNVYWAEEKNSDFQKWTFQEVSGSSGKYVWPTESYRVTNEYGNGHLGIDIGALTPNVDGDSIYAFMEGYVSFIGNPSTNSSEGYTVRIHHTNPLKSINKYEKIRTQYMHMQTLPRVSVGDYVKAGTFLGYMGNTGNSTATHLHFEVRGGSEKEFPTNGTSSYGTGVVLDPNLYLDLA